LLFEKDNQNTGDCSLTGRKAYNLSDLPLIVGQQISGGKTMNKNDYIIRNERKEEQREVEFLVRESFWNVYRPGCLEHYVLNHLRDDADFIPELNFVMEKDGRIIGQNMFMKAVIKADNGRVASIIRTRPKA